MSGAILLHSSQNEYFARFGSGTAHRGSFRIPLVGRHFDAEVKRFFFFWTPLEVNSKHLNMHQIATDRFAKRPGEPGAHLQRFKNQLHVARCKKPIGCGVRPTWERTTFGSDRTGLGAHLRAHVVRLNVRSAEDAHSLCTVRCHTVVNQMLTHTHIHTRKQAS